VIVEPRTPEVKIIRLQRALEELGRPETAPEAGIRDATGGQLQKRSIVHSFSQSHLPARPPRKPIVRPCSHSRPRTASSLRLPPAFAVNAYPLFASIIENQAEAPPSLPGHTGFSENTLSRIVQARSVEKFLLVRRGQRTVDYSKNRLMRKRQSQSALLDCKV
jgi:hypothetical protein